MRKIVYLTGSRADFSPMLATLKAIQADPDLQLEVLVTGMHLDTHYGHTVDDIVHEGFTIAAKVPVPLRGENESVAMARAIGHEVVGLSQALADSSPDFLLVLGDRGEMLAGAISALHLNIPTIHLHGGELSGTVDEPVRHAISKLSHYHFTSTEGARDRLVRMGEKPDTVFVVGAPGLDGLTDLVCHSRAELAAQAGFSPVGRIALVVFHAVVQQAAEAYAQAQSLCHALTQVPGLQCLLLTPNADAGGEGIRKALAETTNLSLKIVHHLPRADFISWMAAADVMVGNSSSAIIEAASFDLPVVNIGDRQNGRERSANVQDVAVDETAIAGAIKAALAQGRPEVTNTYGDGHTAGKIVSLLKDLPINPELLLKINAY